MAHIQEVVEDALGGDVYLHCQGSQNILIEVKISYSCLHNIQSKETYIMDGEADRDP